jgi:hypothetical protein
MKREIMRIVLLLLLLVPVSGKALPQETEMISPYLMIQYFKDTENQKMIRGTLTYSKNRMELPLPGMKLTFFAGTDKPLQPESPVTDDKGVSVVKLTGDMTLPVDNDGQWTFSVEYAGNDSIEASTAEITVKDIELLMTLSEEDSVKTVNINVKTLVKGSPSPVAGEMLMLYVPRMFSLLPVAEVTLDDNGSAVIEFPSDIPGDKEGNITLIARFDEHMTFGNVERKEIIKWGVPTEYEMPKSHRALWTKTPPWWMIITLSILLAGVWGHYMYAVISLIRIKIDAKKNRT